MDASARSCGRWSFTEPLTDFAVRYSEQVPSKRTLPLTLFKDAREQSPVISSLPFVAETSRLSVRRRVRTIFPFAACMRQLDAEREKSKYLRMRKNNVSKVEIRARTSFFEENDDLTCEKVMLRK